MPSFILVFLFVFFVPSFSSSWSILCFVIFVAFVDELRKRFRDGGTLSSKGAEEEEEWEEEAAEGERRKRDGDRPRGRDARKSEEGQKDGEEKVG